MEYRINDLGHAAALLATGVKLAKLEPSESGRYKIFVFQCSEDDAAATIGKYQRHELMIDAYNFFMQIKELKSLVMEGTPRRQR
jgi:hypothetical protein